MALSHREDSEGFAEKDPGSAVFISDGVAVVVLGVWVDIGLLAGGTRVLGLITRGTKVGNGLLDTDGVVAQSRGLLGLGSGLMSSGS